jgi:hypothetical protein
MSSTLPQELISTKYSSLDLNRKGRKGHIAKSAKKILLPVRLGARFQIGDFRLQIENPATFESENPKSEI